MLGHVHPDADVLGTLLALGLALGTRGWTVAWGGPHPAPPMLAFLPGIERYARLERVEGPLDVAVLTDCPNPERTEGLLDEARRTGAAMVNIDRDDDNRGYGDVNWVEPGAAATGEMIYELLMALGAPITPAIATNLFTAIHMDTGSFRYSNVTPTTFRIGGALVAAGADPAFVSGQLYERRSLEALRWLGQALPRIGGSPAGRVAWLALPAGGRGGWVMPAPWIPARSASCRCSSARPPSSCPTCKIWTRSISPRCASGSGPTPSISTGA